MKNYEIFSLRGWQWMKFDGRKKIFRGIDRVAFEKAKAKSQYRMMRRYVPGAKGRCESLAAVDFCRSGRGTSYEKRIIEGCGYLWFASPLYGLTDYNKSIFAVNTPRNRRKAELINAIAAK